jgi:hypothetical protein
MTVWVNSSIGFAIQGVTIVQGANRTGIWVQQCANGSVQSCQFNGTSNISDFGVVVDGCTNVTVASNTFINQGVGILVEALSSTASQSITLTANSVSSTGGGSGIAAYAVTNLTIQQNAIGTTNIGMVLQENLNFNVSGNTISGGNIGVLENTYNPPAIGVITQNTIGNCQNSGMAFYTLNSNPPNSIQITANQFGECGLTSNGPHTAVIFNSGGAPSGLTLMNNIYTGHNNQLNYYIYSDAHINTVSGNAQSQTVLPNNIP